MDETTVVLDPEREASLRGIGQLSYALHAIVAVGAVLPSLQPSVLLLVIAFLLDLDRKSTRLNSSHSQQSRMPSSA